MSKFLAVLLLIVVFGVIGYVAYSGGFIPKNTIEGVANNIVDYKQPTGDIISIITVPPPEQPRSETSSQDQIMERQRQDTGINASLIQNSTLTGSAGQTYGTTDQYKIPYGANYFKIGTPVVISGKLVKVVPNTCRTDESGNLVNCQYIDPPRFGYNLYITCEFRDFCSISDISIDGKTDNLGFFMEKIQTGSFTKGIYKATVFANSDVKDENGRRYEIKADYYFTMVN